MSKTLDELSKQAFVYECASRALAGVSLTHFLRTQRGLKLAGWPTLVVALSRQATSMPSKVRLDCEPACKLQATLSTQEMGQRHPSFSNPAAKPSIASMVRDAEKLWDELQEWQNRQESE